VCQGIFVPWFWLYVHNAWEFYNFGRDLHNATFEQADGWFMSPPIYFHHHVLSQKAIRKYNSFLNTQPLNFMHWTFPDFMSLASLFCIKSQVVKFCILIYFHLFVRIGLWPLFPGNIHSGISNSICNTQDYYVVVVLAVRSLFSKVILLPTQKKTLTTWPILLNNFVKCLTSHHWLQSPLKVKMINIHSPEGLTLMFPVHFKGDGSNDPTHSQVYYNRQDLTWPNGELNQK